MQSVLVVLAAVGAVSLGSAARADNRFYSVRRLVETPGLPQASINSYTGSMELVTGDGQAAGRYTYGAWYFDGQTGRQMGFRGPLFDEWNGRTNSYVWDIRGPYISGMTTTLDGEYRPWCWSAGVLTPIVGLADAEHTTPGGQRRTVGTVGADGTIAGTNRRYLGNAENGTTAWVTQNGVTERIGLISGAYTRADGYRVSEIQSFTPDSAVLGWSTVYAANGTGRTAWVWVDGVMSIVPGLEGAGYVNSSGNRETLALLRNTAGDIVGTTRRFSGTFASRGEAAFLQRAGTTVRLGLTDAVHTAADGTQLTENLQLLADGTVFGTSRRYPLSGSSPTGQSAWVYKDGVTTVLGLTGSGFHSPSARDGISNAYIAGPDGAIYGTTLRSTPGGGYAAWRFLNGTTTELGVDGPQFRAPTTGARWNNVHKAVDAGVLGSVYRYTGSQVDNNYWWLDNATGQYTVFPPIFSSTGDSDMFVGDTDHAGRTLVGRMTYQQWEPLVARASLFLPGDGLIDLDSRVLGGYQWLGVRTLAGRDTFGRWPTRVLEDGDRLYVVGLDVDGNSVPLLLDRIDCPADMGSTGGVPSADGTLDVNDFVVFIDSFFARDPFADVGGVGGTVGSDGAFDNNDFVVFVDLFFTGC